MNIKRVPVVVPANILTGFSGNNPTAFTAALDLPRDQYLRGIRVLFLGRLTIATAAGTAVASEAPFNLIRRIRVSANHQIFGTIHYRNLSGSTAWLMEKIYAGTAPIAFSSPALSYAVGTYDLEVEYLVNFWPSRVNQFHAVPFLLDSPRTSSLRLEMDFAPPSDLVTPGGTTVETWTQYGSTTGTPQIFIIAEQVNGLKHNPLTGAMTVSDRVDSLVSANPVNQAIGNPLPIGAAVRSLLLKQYVGGGPTTDYVSSTLSPKNQSDNGLARPQVFKNLQRIREWNSWAELEAENKRHFQMESWPSGVGIIDFAEDGLLNDILFTQTYGAQGVSFNYGGQVNAVANGSIEAVITQFLANPGT